MIFIKATITYFYLKCKMYLKKVPVMKNNALAVISGFANINPTMF